MDSELPCVRVDCREHTHAHAPTCTSDPVPSLGHRLLVSTLPSPRPWAPPHVYCRFRAHL